MALGGRLSALCALAVASAVVVIGCGSTAPPASAPDLIRSTWSDVFAGPSGADRSSFVEGGAPVATVLAGSAAPSAVHVTGVTLSDPSHASVSFSLVLAHGRRLPSVGGAAVRVGGRWLVSRSTVCAVAVSVDEGTSVCG